MNIRKVRKISDSLVVSIPSEICKRKKIKAGDKLSCEDTEDGILYQGV